MWLHAGEEPTEVLTISFNKVETGPVHYEVKGGEDDPAHIFQLRSVSTQVEGFRVTISDTRIVRTQDFIIRVSEYLQKIAFPNAIDDNLIAQDKVTVAGIIENYIAFM